MRFQTYTGHEDSHCPRVRNFFCLKIHVNPDFASCLVCAPGQVGWYTSSVGTCISHQDSLYRQKGEEDCKIHYQTMPNQVHQTQSDNMDAQTLA